MDKMTIGSLPGIGWKLEKKFNQQLGIKTCGDLRYHSKWSKLHELQKIWYKNGIKYI